LYWLCKMLGGLLVFGACALFGLRLSRRDMLLIKELSALRSALLTLKSEIQYARTPLAAAFEHTASLSDGQTAQFFQSMAERLGENSGLSAAQIWEDVLNDLRKTTLLADEDFRRLALLGQSIGCLDSLTQAEGLDAAMRHIDERILLLRDHSDKHARMYRSVGALCGALIAVALM